MEPYYEDDAVTLWHGDCREVIPSIDLTGVRLVLADPPYGETSLAWDRWPDSWPDLMTTTQAASMWCFGSLRMFLEHRDEFAGWRLSQDVIWEKHNGATFHADRFARVHETVTHWYRGPWGEVYKSPQYTMDATKRAVRRKGRPVHTGNIGDSSYLSEDGGPRLMRSVIQHRSMHGYAIHPTEKPTGLLERLIDYASMPGSLVLDPFAGSGSTLEVCKATGRRAVGIEADERYCEAAARRLSQGVLEVGA